MVARTPEEHAAINAREYPGTRQLCCVCAEPTGRCEDDTITVDGEGPLCEDCRDERLADHGQFGVGA